jgi:hypothetical protein
MEQTLENNVTDEIVALVTVVSSAPSPSTSKVRPRPPHVQRTVRVRLNLVKAGCIISRGKYAVASLHIHVQKQINSPSGVDPLIEARTMGNIAT